MVRKCLVHTDEDCKILKRNAKRYYAVIYFVISEILVFAARELRIAFVWNEMKRHILGKRNSTFFWFMTLRDNPEEQNYRVVRFAVVPLRISGGKIMNVLNRLDIREHVLIT